MFSMTLSNHSLDGWPDAAHIDARHSLGAWFVTTVAKKGKSLDAIMRETDHESVEVARSHIRHVTAFEGNASRGLA